MSDPRGLLDTSVIVLFDHIDHADLPDEPAICTITLAELSAGPAAAADPAEQAIRQWRLQNAESSFDAIEFDAAAARAFGSVSASIRRQGAKTRARSFDALIAAVAMANALPLYTCNPRDFEGIEGLSVRAVAHPAW